MDYESILFGLQPIINADPINSIPLQDVYLQSYITVLDQLAVSLRAPNNREIVGQTGLLSNLLRVLEGILDIFFHDDNLHTSTKFPWVKLASELVRGVANSLVDNNNNREIFIQSDLSKKHMLLDYYIPRVLKMTELPDDDVEGSVLSTFQMRSIVLIKNFCLDNAEYIKKCSQTTGGSLLAFLKAREHIFLEEIDSVLLAAELLNDFIKVSGESLVIKFHDLLFISGFIKRLATLIEHNELDNIDSTEVSKLESEEVAEDIEQESDPNVEIAMDLAIGLETLVSGDQFYHLEISTEDLNSVSTIQKNLFEALRILNPKVFSNKLIIMRRLSASIGHISANPTNNNKSEQFEALHILSNSKDGYLLSAAAIVLSNSINSRENADEISLEIELTQLFKSLNELNDPLQFQGFLELIKKLLNMKTVMFLTALDLEPLLRSLQFCHDQTSYFTTLGPLLNNLLSKLLVVLPSSTVLKLANTDTTNNLVSLVTARGGIVACLMLDKLLVSKTVADDNIVQTLFKSAFKFEDASLSSANGSIGASTSISLPFLFQLSKTVGIYLKNCDNQNISGNLVLKYNSHELESILTVILSLMGKEDGISKSVLNNGEFIAGMLINIFKKETTLTSQEEEIRKLALQFF